MKAPDRPIANPAVVLREEFDDWAVLFNPDTSVAMGVNPVGVHVWGLLDGGHTVEEIAADVGEHFDEVPEAAPNDVSAFVTELCEKGFVGEEVDAGQ